MQRRRKYETNKKLISDYKKEKYCEKCGYKEHPEILCFHHLGKEPKKFEINSSSIRATKTILKEIDKCILLCPNCHQWLHLNSCVSIEIKE